MCLVHLAVWRCSSGSRAEDAEVSSKKCDQLNSSRTRVSSIWAAAVATTNETGEIKTRQEPVKILVINLMLALHA